MVEGHGRFAALAVGHVLGGLHAADARAFRDHLGGCPDCRARVAELRGIADELEAAEREERDRAPVPVRTEVPRRADEIGPPTLPRIGVRHVTVAALVVLALASAIGFWNLHLRASVTTHRAVATDRATTLGHLARGEVVPVEAAGVARGVAALDGEVLAVSVSGLARLGDRTWYVVWALDDAGGVVDTWVLAGPGQLGDGLLPFWVPVADASRIVVTTESRSTEVPRGPTVVEVDVGA